MYSITHRTIHLLPLLLLSTCSLGFSMPVINEFVSSNGSVISDENGDFEDWIELYNPTDEVIDLTGYGLSDNESEPFRWVFPEVSLEPGGFLLVWASGKDRTNPESPLHTNFAISSSGEELLLTTPNGDVIDFVPPIELARDHSFGRKPDGDASWYIFAEPTPGSSNTTTGYEEILDPPAVSHVSGYYAEPFDLHVTAPPGTIIRYTTDGSMPGPGSPVFPEPLLVDTREDDPNEISIIPTNDSFRGNTAQEISGWKPPQGHVGKATMLRLRKFREGSLPSPVVNRTFWVGDRFEEHSTVPVVSFVIDWEDLFDHDRGIYVPGANYRTESSWPELTGNYFQRGIEWERPVHMEFFEPGWQEGFSMDAGLRIHGGLTRRWPLKSLRVYMRGSYEASNLDYPLFPDNNVTTFRRFILRNSGNDSGFENWGGRDDGTLMRDPLMHMLVQDLDLDTQDYRPSIVYLGGEYWGIHNIRERQDRHTLAIRHNVNPDSIDRIANNGSVQDGSRNDFFALHQYAMENDLADPEHFAHMVEQLDEKNLADYFLVQLYAGNRDWPGNNLQYWRSNDPPTRWRWIMYDVEWAVFGHLFPDNANVDAMERNLDHHHRSPEIIRAMLHNEEYKRYFVNRCADLLNSTFLPHRVINQIDKMADVLRPHIATHIARWGRPSSAEQWEGNLETLRRYALERPPYMRAHFSDYFGLNGSFRLGVTTNKPAAGSVRVNTLTISRPDFDWEGFYFRDLPVDLEAIPNPGYIFTGWDGDLTTNTLALSHGFSADSVIRANFQEDPDYIYEGPGPDPWKLAEESYVWQEWSPSEPPGSFPQSMQFLQYPSSDPTMDRDMVDPWILSYDLDNRSRFVGLGNRGLGVINTANPQEDGGGYLGSVILALDTRQVGDGRIGFTAGTKLPNSRKYALRLRYRIGDSGPFSDVLDDEGEPVEYIRSPNAGHEHRFDMISIPADALSQGYIQLEWRYHYTGVGTSGPRSKLRLDNVTVHAIPYSEAWVIH